MQVKTTSYHLTPVRMAVIQKTRAKCWKVVEKREPLCTVGGNVSWRSHCGNSMEGPPRFRNETAVTIWQSHFGVYVPKGDEIAILEISALSCSLQHLQQPSN